MHNSANNPGSHTYTYNREVNKFKKKKTKQKSHKNEYGKHVIVIALVIRCITEDWSTVSFPVTVLLAMRERQTFTIKLTR